MLLKVYEISNGTITGYKVYHQGKQIATLELRDQLWIAGTVKGVHVQTKSSPEFAIAYDWIKHQAMS